MMRIEVRRDDDAYPYFVEGERAYSAEDVAEMLNALREHPSETRASIVEECAQVVVRLIDTMTAHRDPGGMKTGTDFYADELDYIVPLLEKIRALTNAAPQERNRDGSGTPTVASPAVLLPSAALPTQPPQESDTARSETVAGSSSPAVAAPAEDARAGFYSGVMSALAVVYSHDDATATLPVEIVRTMDGDALLAAAIREEDYNVDQIRKTVKAAKDRR